MMTGMGEIERIAELQRQLNEEWATMTPQERAQAARRDLERMPGQAYLFGEGRESVPHFTHSAGPLDPSKPGRDAESHPKAVKSCAAAERPRLVATMHPYGRGVTV
jgi:hypothetical protein